MEILKKFKMKNSKINMKIQLVISKVKYLNFNNN